MDGTYATHKVHKVSIRTGDQKTLSEETTWET